MQKSHQLPSSQRNISTRRNLQPPEETCSCAGRDGFVTPLKPTPQGEPPAAALKGPPASPVPFLLGRKDVGFHKTQGTSSQL